MAQPGAAATESTAKAAACEAGTNGLATFYAGPAAALTYDTLFKAGVAVPHLSTHVPQGMATWKNWDGKGGTLIVVGMYKGGSNSYLAVLDGTTGKHRATIRIAESHLGGIAIAGAYLFGQDAYRPGTQDIRRYRLDKLRKAVRTAIAEGTKPYVGREAGVQRVYGADFMTSSGGRVWSGRYAWETERMYEYTVDDAGKLRNAGAAWQVPPRTQGVLVTGSHFVFNTFAGRAAHATMVVAERSRDLATADQRCFAAPSMSQGMTLVGDRLHVVYESGAAKYADALNPVKRLHVASLKALRGLLDE